MNIGVDFSRRSVSRALLDQSSAGSVNGFLRADFNKTQSVMNVARK
jgi:hypothetical protein